MNLAHNEVEDYPRPLGMSFRGEIGLEQEFDPFSVFREAFGFVPNLVRAQMALPRVIAAHAKLEEAVWLRGGAIPRTQKERILLSIAADRRDNYWAALGAELLISLGVKEADIDDLLNDYQHAGLSAPDRALLKFSLKLSRDSTSIDLADIEALRAQGFADEAIVEAVVLTAVAIYRCTLSVALGPEPDFKVRNLPPKKMRGAVEELPARRMASKKGPYVAAPYLSPNTFKHFDVVQKSHGFIPNFFRAQTLRPRFARSGIGCGRGHSAPRGRSDTSSEGVHSIGNVSGKPQLLLRGGALQYAPRLRSFRRGSRPDCS